MKLFSMGKKNSANWLVAAIFFAALVIVDAWGQVLASGWEKENELKTGDIIFQSSHSGQSAAIQMATHSKYTHCGIVQLIGEKVYVYEAVGPVKLTPFKEWTAMGDGGHFVVKRLKDRERVLTPAVLARMQASEESFEGKPYDFYFEWSDDRIYCSELVWKVYKQATGLELGKLERLKDFDLTSPLVKKIMKERYGDHPPLDEKVISPAAIFQSDLLTDVESK